LDNGLMIEKKKQKQKKKQPYAINAGCCKKNFAEVWFDKLTTGTFAKEKL
tara:strand:+ start:2055 stop:2204 length:150 start_codon:yes stop_codon:yes gene_type:complete